MRMRFRSPMGLIMKVMGLSLASSRSGALMSNFAEPNLQAFHYTGPQSTKGSHRHASQCRTIAAHKRYRTFQRRLRGKA